MLEQEQRPKGFNAQRRALFAGILEHFVQARDRAVGSTNESYYRLSRQAISRRLALGAGIGAALAWLSLPKEVQAATWIDLNPNSGNGDHPEVQVAEWKEVGPDAGDLNQREWFPFDLRLARDRVLMRMHDFGGPLDVYDEIVGHHYDERGHAREWAEDYAGMTLRNHPERRSWGGYCHAVANTMSYQEPLVIGRYGSYEYEGLKLRLPEVIGLYAAIHASDAEVGHMSTLNGIKAILAKAIDKGWAPVANIPDKPGVWQRSIKKVRADLEAVEASAFGVTRIFPTSAVRGIYFPDHYNPRDQKDTQRIAAAARVRTSGYINPELDYVKASRIARNLSLEADIT